MSAIRDGLATEEQRAAILNAHKAEQMQNATPGDFSEVAGAASTAATPEILPAWNVAAFSPRRFFDTDPAPFEYIIPGLLAKALCGFLYGEGGTYKSLAALWLVILRACGQVNFGAKWLDRFEIPGAGRSVFFSAEDVDIDLHHRVRAIADRIAADRPDIPPSIIGHAISENCLIVSREGWVSDGELFLVDEEGTPTAKYSEIVNVVRTFGADLVILETFSRIANVDEIDNRLAARVVGAMESLRDATGATVLCIAHTSKASRGGSTDTHGQNGLRGASALMDNARFGLWFRAQPTHEGQGCFEIQHSKPFRGMRADSFKVAVDFPAFVLVEGKQAGPDAFEKVVAFIRENPGCTVRQVRTAVPGRAATTGQAIKDAIAEGQVEERAEPVGNQSGAKPRKLYHVAESI